MFHSSYFALLLCSVDRLVTVTLIGLGVHAQKKSCKLDCLCFPGTPAPRHSLVALCMYLDCL